MGNCSSDFMFLRTMWMNSIFVFSFIHNSHWSPPLWYEYETKSEPKSKSKVFMHVCYVLSKLNETLDDGKEKSKYTHSITSEGRKNGKKSFSREKQKKMRKRARWVLGIRERHREGEIFHDKSRNGNTWKSRMLNNAMKALILILILSSHATIRKIYSHLSPMLKIFSIHNIHLPRVVFLFRSFLFPLYFMLSQIFALRSPRRRIVKVIEWIQKRTTRKKKKKRRKKKNRQNERNGIEENSWPTNARQRSKFLLFAKYQIACIFMF